MFCSQMRQVKFLHNDLLQHNTVAFISKYGLRVNFNELPVFPHCATLLD